MDNRATMIIFDEYEQIACVLKCEYIVEGSITGCWRRILHNGQVENPKVF